MENLQVTTETILVIIGGLLVIMNFLDKLKSWVAPTYINKRSVNERLAKHDELLDNDNKRLASLEGQISTIGKENKRFQLDVYNHFIDGNGVEKMKENRQKLMESLID